MATGKLETAVAASRTAAVFFQEFFFQRFRDEIDGRTALHSMLP